MVRLTFLGTSDAIPSSDRNHFSIWLNHEGENILIDCGEGTQRQMRRAKLNPCRVNRILITHIHADHILGLVGLLKTMDLSGYNKTLYLYGPKGFKKFIDKLFSTFDISPEYDIELQEVVGSGKFFESEDYYLEAKSMVHGVPCNAYNFVLKGKNRIDRAKLKKSGLSSGPVLKEIKDGKDIVFEGKKYKAKDLTYKEEDKKISFVIDTKDNEKIAPFVKNSDLFISECAFEKDLEDKAKEHKHMTTEQVGNIAKKAGVKKLVLVHVSQRYEKEMDLILKEVKKIFKNAILPKDLDSLVISD